MKWRLRAAGLGRAAALCLAGGLIAAAPSSAALGSAEIERRVEDLLRRMTLEEKIGQLSLVSNGPLFRRERVTEGRVGALSNFSKPHDIADIQKLARTSRLGIPPLFSLDILHGFRTMFPVPLAEAATFNPSLARAAAEEAAREATSVGLQWTFAPMADLARDPRWGRMVEGFGEDVHMGEVFTAARVAGFRAGGLATSVKHFAGYGAAAGGRDYDTTDISPAELRNLYLPPFRAALDAGGEIVMSAFNALNGVPATANPWLLTTVLREEWGFDGFVVADWGAIEELVAHGIAADGAEAARKAINAGVDMDMASDLYDNHLAAEVKAGRVSEATLDDSVRRVLRVKFRLGLFDRPDIDQARGEAALMTPSARRTARAVAQEGMVLLKNDGVLPLKPGTGSIAVVGSLAASGKDQLGPHEANARAEDVITLLDGVRQRARAAGATVVFEPGCDKHCTTTEGFGRAVAAARAADVVIAVLGEPQEITGEAASRASLTLPGRQRELLDALVAAGKPVVLAMLAARPLALGAAAETVPAILMTWFLGTEGGPAFADVLFGDVAPSGKLPITWPRSVGQVPIHYDRLPTGRPTLEDNRFTLRYADEEITPLYPFGFGLSYTYFSYSDLVVATSEVEATGMVEVRATVTNIGARAGKEVAQLYVRDVVASRSRPVRQLKAFEKIAIEPGQSRLVTFRVPARQLGFHEDDGAYVVEPGEFQVWIGGDSRAELGGRFSVINGLHERPGEERRARVERQPEPMPAQ